MKTALLAATVAAAAIAGGATAASAAPIYATSANIVSDGAGRSSANNRDVLSNAFGERDGKFFELGFGGIVDFFFGDPTGQKFISPGKVVEVTFGNVTRFNESVDIFGLMNGVVSSERIARVDNANAQANTNGRAFTFEGTFDGLRFVDTSTARNPDGVTGGFDVDSISVSPVPVPAAGLLLIAGLGGLAATRRRKAAAA